MPRPHPGEITNANGTIFIDCRNASGFSDSNTCTYERDDGRYVVVGKLTRIH